MTYRDKFTCFENYQKHEAQEMLDFEKEGNIYSESQGKLINCFTRLEEYMTKQELQEKKEKIENIKRLQRILDGKENSQIYFMYWEHLKDTEYPSWKD